MATIGRRRFLAALGASAGVAGLSGCVSGGPAGGRRSVDRTLYVGAYHWGFVLLDGSGTERDRVVLDRETSFRLVAFNTSAEEALETLPARVRDAVPDHHDLEARNEERVPPPRGRDLHEALEEANERYPDHSVALMPSGWNHMRGGRGGGTMMHPIALPHTATRPATVTLTATQRGDYTFSCMTYCGYGHDYMDLDGGLVVR